MRSEVEAVHQELHRKRVTSTSLNRPDSTHTTPKEVFIIMKQEEPPYEEPTLDIGEVYAMVEKANEAVVKLFAKHYGDFMREGDANQFVKKRIDDSTHTGEDQEVWWIDK